MEARPFDPAQYLDSEEAVAADLPDAGADGDKALSGAAEVVARVRRRQTAASSATVPSALGVAETGGEPFRRDAARIEPPAPHGAPATK